MTIDDLKRSEATLMKILYDYKMKLWEAPLTQEEKAEIETRFLLLKNATEYTFLDKYKSPSIIGNV
jgi:hypothetical protein